MSLIQIGNKCLQSCSLLAKVARGADKLLEFAHRDASNGRDTECSGSAEITERALHVLPTRVLREKSTDDHLKAGTRRPPMKRPVTRRQCVVKISNLPI